MNVTQPNGDKVIYDYDVLGRRTSLTDGENVAGNVTSWTYDAAGRTLSETTSFGTESFVYDRAGRLIEKSITQQTLRLVLEVDAGDLVRLAR